MTSDRRWSKRRVTNVKYKLMLGDGIGPNLYQLVAFATAFGVRQGALISFRDPIQGDLPACESATST